jgi:hypothetical protein
MLEDKAGQSGSSRALFLRSVLYTVLGLAAICIPIAIRAAQSRFLHSSYGKDHAPFEVFGFTAACSLAVIAGIELRRRLGKPKEEWLLIILPLVVSLHYLVQINEHSMKRWDYECYECAAAAVLKGENPYLQENIQDHHYLYPPLPAQSMAEAYRLVEGLAARLGLPGKQEVVFLVIFYFYQCLQFLMVLAAYYLCYRLARSLGLEAKWANVLVAVLLIANNPLLRTVRHQQINVWILDLALVGILLARRAPFLGGAAIALAGQIKLYPLMMLLPLAAARCWRVVTWTLAVFAAITFLQTDFGRDFTLWEQFLAFSGDFPRSLCHRNNSLRNISFNVVRLFAGDAAAEYQHAAAYCVTAALAAIGIWFVLRLFARERAFAALPGEAGPDGGAGTDSFRIVGHCADALAFALLMSPSVWEHHYVLAMPLVIWAVVIRGRERPWLVAIGTFLVIVMPTFDLFPFSYHRLLGTILLLCLTSPRRFALPRQAPGLTEPEAAPGTG